MESQIHSERMERFGAAGLYLVTSESMSGGRPTTEVVKDALKGGVRLIQLREKGRSDSELLELAESVREMTAKAGAILLINDRIDIAQQCGADGVHLGLDDMPLAEAREKAPDMIIGGSSHSLEEALSAQAAGASYVNIGPIYPTRTKNWEQEFLGPESIREIAPHLTIPWTVMGGIKKHHIPALMAEGARTIAVVTAVTMEADIASAAHEILEIMHQCGKE